MYRCPKCSASLTEEQLGTGVCPKCGAKQLPATDEHSQPLPAGTLGPTDFVLQQESDNKLDTGKELPPTLIQSTQASSSQESDETDAPESGPEPGLQPTLQSKTGFPADSSAKTKGEMESPQPETSATRPKTRHDRDAKTARPHLEATIVQEGLASRSSQMDRRSKSDDRRSTAVRYGSSISPMSTLKSKEVEQVREEGLVIQKRRLRSKDASDVDEADYQVVREIGKGGMGRVHLAVQTALNRRVAVKELNPKTAREPQNRRKFLSEAAITGELDHPNIVPVHDVGVNSDGRLFYSMKMISGHEWQERIAHISRSDNVDILMRVADAVSFAHSRNVIHRDLKPENVMLGGFGEVLVTDWGLAVHLTGKQGFVAGGTPCYMAPEMAAHYIHVESERNPVAREHFETTLPSSSHALINDRLAPIDKWSDIYLLGAMLFQIATGAPPHTGKSVSECLARAVSNEIVTHDHDNELVAIALKAMATDPADRYASVDALQQAIREHQTHNQSIALTTKAHEDLGQALREGHYEQFQRAMFGFQEAVDLWPGNTRAVDGVGQAKLAYARRALAQNDFDLGLQLLDPTVDDERALHQQFVRGARDRDTRARRMAFFRATAAICALLLISGGLFFSLTMKKKNLELAKTNEELDKQRTVAEENAETARTEAENAKAAKADADKQREKAETARTDAEENRKLAESRELVAQTGRFAATFSLAKTYIAANNAERAARQLVTLREQDDEFSKSQFQNQKASPPDPSAKDGGVEVGGDPDPRLDRHSLIDWEWHRLNYLCHPHDPQFGVTELQVSDTAVAMAATPDGHRVVVGTADKRLLICERGAVEPIVELPVPIDAFRSLHAVAVSPDGRFVAMGGTALDRDAASFQLWDIQPTPPVLVFKAAPLAPREASRRRASDVFSIDFSADGLRIVAGCSEGIAVWARNGEEPWSPQPFQRGLSGDYKSVRFVPSSPHRGTAVIQIAGVARYGIKGARHQRAFICELARRAGKAESQTSPWKWEYKGIDQLPGVFNTVDVSPVDPHLVALGAADGSVVLWTWNAPADKRNSNHSKKGVTLDLFGHTRGIRDVTFSKAHTPDGRHTLLTASDDQSLIAWDLHRLGMVEEDRSDTHRENVDQVTTLWKATRSRRIPAFRGHTDAVIACSYVTRPLRVGEADDQSSSARNPDASDAANELISAAADGRLRRWALDRYRDERVFVQNSNDMACTAAAVFASESGIHLAAAGADGHARVWDAANGRLLAELAIGHERGAAVVPKPAIVDGNLRIVTCGSDGQMVLWDGKTGIPISAQTVVERETNGTGIRFGGNGVVPFDISPDGKHVATGEGSNQSHHVAAALWNTASGQKEKSDLFKAQSKFAEAARFWIPTKTLTFAGSPQRLLISTGQGRVFVWDQKDDRAWEVVSAEKPARIGVFRTRDGQFDITLDRRHLKIWPPFEPGNRPPKPLKSVALPGNIRAFCRAAASDEEAFLLLLGKNIEQGVKGGAIELWNRQSLLDGQPIAKQDGHFVSAAISPHGKMVLAVTGEKKLLQWNLLENRLQPLRGDVNRSEPNEIIFVDNHHFLTATQRHGSQRTGGRGWQGRLWRLTGDEEAREEARLTSRSEIRDVRFSADGTEVQTVSADGAIRSWPISKGQASSVPSRPLPSRQFSDLAFETVKELALSPGGELAVSLNHSGNVMRIWKPQTGEEVSRIDLRGKSSGLQIARGRIAVLTEENDESTIDRGTIRMWDTRSGRLTELAGPPMRTPGRRMALAETGQGVVLAVAHTGPNPKSDWISVWRLADDGNWSDEMQIAADTSRITSITVSPSGRRLVLGERSGDIALWRIDSNQSGNHKAGTEQSGPLLTLRRHASAVTSIRFSNDGKHLVSTDAAGNTIFWPSSGWNDMEPSPPTQLAKGRASD